MSPASTADIVAEEKGVLVFIDVNTYSNSDKSFPSDRADALRRTRCEMIALAHLAEHELVNTMVRFDSVALVFVKTNQRMIRHHIEYLSIEADCASPNLSCRPLRPFGLQWASSPTLGPEGFRGSKCSVSRFPP